MAKERRQTQPEDVKKEQGGFDGSEIPALKFKVTPWAVPEHHQTSCEFKKMSPNLHQSWFRDFVKTKPRLYDFTKNFYRKVVKTNDPSFRFLDQFSKTKNGQVHFIQIGANDGLRCDPLREFIYRDNWSGILIEPLPSVFELLQKNYKYLAHKRRLTFSNIAISNQSGQKIIFWTLKKEFMDRQTTEVRLDYLRKSSFDKGHVLKCLEGKVENPESVLEPIEVPVQTINEVIVSGNFPGPLDLLAIDAEGHEETILTSLDYTIYKPTCIYFESHNLGKRVVPLFKFLEAKEYAIIPLGGNTAAMLRN